MRGKAYIHTDAVAQRAERAHRAMIERDRAKLARLGKRISEAKSRRLLRLAMKGHRP
jgi:hypothetical protein